MCLHGTATLGISNPAAKNFPESGSPPAPKTCPDKALGRRAEEDPFMTKPAPVRASVNLPAAVLETLAAAARARLVPGRRRRDHSLFPFMQTPVFLDEIDRAERRDAKRKHHVPVLVRKATVGAGQNVHADHAIGLSLQIVRHLGHRHFGEANHVRQINVGSVIRTVSVAAAENQPLCFDDLARHARTFGGGVEDRLSIASVATASRPCPRESRG